MYGIAIGPGSNLLIFNNLISLTTSSEVIRTICGIYDMGQTAGHTARIYYNTVMIDGIAPGTAANTSNSYGIWNYYGANNPDYRNNIFSNFRRNSDAAATGRHYAISFENNPTGTVNLDYNNYYASGLGGAVGHIGPHDGGTIYPTLADWQGALGTQDAHSVSVDPVYTTPGGTNPPNYIPHAAMPGLTGLGGINDDFGNNGVRVAPVTMGAWENECNGLMDDEPDDVTECESGNVSFTVSVTNVSSPAYQWQVSTDGGYTWTDLTENPPYSGTQTATLVITGITLDMNGYRYRCIITDDDNNDCVVTSQAAELTITPRPATGAIWHR